MAVAAIWSDCRTFLPTCRIVWLHYPNMPIFNTGSTTPSILLLSSDWPNPRGRPHESDDSGRRLRQTHAAIDRPLPQTVAAGGGQTADRTSPGASGDCQYYPDSHQCQLSGRTDHVGTGRRGQLRSRDTLEPGSHAAGNWRWHPSGTATAG